LIVLFLLFCSFFGLPQQPVNETTNELSRRGHGKEKIFQHGMRFSTPALAECIDCNFEEDPRFLNRTL